MRLSKVRAHLFRLSDRDGLLSCGEILDGSAQAIIAGYTSYVDKVLELDLPRLIEEKPRLDVSPRLRYALTQVQGSLIECLCHISGQ